MLYWRLFSKILHDMATDFRDTVIYIILANVYAQIQSLDGSNSRTVLPNFPVAFHARLKSVSHLLNRSLSYPPWSSHVELWFDGSARKVFNPDPLIFALLRQ